MKKILVLGLWLLASTTYGQSISGIVKDIEDHTLLPFVSISIEGTSFGTTSDIDGYFRLTPDSYPVTLHFHTLGYSDTILTFTKPQVVKVVLREQAKQLREATFIAGENPAIAIIKKAIANRDINNPEKNYSFSYETYSKMVFGPDMSQFDNDLTLTDSSSAADSSQFYFTQFMSQHYLFMTETVSERKFLPPSHSYEKIIANRFSGLKNPSFSLMASEFQPFSYYSDYVDVIGLKYLSPLARNSFKDYVFELKDSLFENGDSVFIIYFQPKKGSTFNGLVGTLAINNNQYAIQSIRAKQASSISNVQVEMEQMSEFIDEKQWFPVQFNTHLIMNLDPEDNDDLALSLINARGRTYIKNIKLNVPLSKSDFPNVKLELDDKANEQTDAFWEGERKEKLDRKEAATYVVIDSIGEAQKLDVKLKIIEQIAFGYVPLGPVSIELNKLINYNEVEGLRIGVGLRTNEKISKYFSVGGYGAYGIEDKKFKYGGDLKLNIYPKNDVFAGVKYFHDVTPTGMVEYHKKPEFDLRSYTDLYISKMDDIDGVEVYLNFRSFRDFQNKIFYNNYDQSYAHPYTYAPKGDTVLTAENSFKRSEIGWSFRFGFKEKYIRTFNTNISLGTKFPYLWVRVAASDAVLGSTFTYQKVDGRIAKNYLVKGVGKIGFQLSAGTTFGEVPLSFLTYGSGMRVSGFNLYIENAFNTMAPNEFVSQTYASGFLHYNMGALYKVKNSATELSLVTGIGWGTLENPEYHQGLPFQTMEKGFFESGLLFDNVFVYNTLGIGVGVFYRYGPYALPEVKDNFGFNMTVLYVIQ